MASLMIVDGWAPSKRIGLAAVWNLGVGAPKPERDA